MPVRHPPWLPEADLNVHEIGGTYLAYAEMGEGEPIVFIPGYEGTSANFVPQMREFAKSHRVVCIDPIGCGYSDRPHTSYEPREFVRLTRRFMEMTGVWPANLVGHSLGGAVAYAIAADYPELVLRLALVSAYPPRPASTRRATRAFTYLAGRWPAGVELVLRATSRPRARRAAGFLTVDRDARDELARLHSGKGRARIQLRTLLNSHLWSEWQGRLIEIEAPTMIIWGEYDRVLPPENLRELGAELPDAKQVTVEGGHLPMIESPVEVNVALRDLISIPVRIP